MNLSVLVYVIALIMETLFIVVDILFYYVEY